MRIFPLNMRGIVIRVARWWEKYFSKYSLLKHTCSLRDRLIVLLVLVTPQNYSCLSLLIWDFILFLELLGLLSNKFDFWRSPEIRSLLARQCHVRDWTCHLSQEMPLFRKWVDSLFTSGLLHNFTQVKVKEVFLKQWALHLKKLTLLKQKYHCEVGIIIALN